MSEADYIAKSEKAWTPVTTPVPAGVGPGRGDCGRGTGAQLAPGSTGAGSEPAGRCAGSEAQPVRLITFFCNSYLC